MGAQGLHTPLGGEGAIQPALAAVRAGFGGIGFEFPGVCSYPARQQRRNLFIWLDAPWSRQMKAIPVSETVTRIPLLQPDLVNVYLVGGVLIDSGGRLGARRLLRFLRRHRPTAHVLTHAHLDHQGCSRVVCQEFGIPFFCGEGDRKAAETGDQRSLMRRSGPVRTGLMNLLSGPGHPVSGTLTEGDEFGGLKVIETPGHTPGHLAFWEEKTRVLILGDVLFHRNPVTFRKGLSEPFLFATYDRASNLRSVRKLTDLKAETICFGHGAPLTDGDEFRRFVESLPRP